MNNLKQTLIPIWLLRYFHMLKYKVASFSDHHSINKDQKSIFSAIHEENYWRSEESVSGIGSEANQTKELSAGLVHVLSKYNIETLLDVPCGDFNWMSRLHLVNIDYIGADIVADLVENNNRKYSSESIRFVNLDLISQELPMSDMIFCRDCLVHFSYDDIWSALCNIIRSGSKYLLTTSFPETKWNHN
ncbi:MAG: class I SAM-dependent methyltransferase, partial [Flavobacterium sp.]